ncbi:MAG TPA: hypothetical protein VFY87_27450 [Geminicoccaceae bacterium]|nr:hypothetical protein [Geminicoccaceae bacterium]
MEDVMKKLVPMLMGLSLISTVASAEPAKLSEGELGQVAAGQDVGSGFSLSVVETATNTQTTTTTENVNDQDTAVSTFTSNATATQNLAGQSSNTVNALGLLGSTGVSATGNANAVLTGTIANTVP